MRIPTSIIGSRGFTLIELLIVLLIIGVITSVATLSINTARLPDGQILYSQLQNQLHLAKQTAQLKNVNLRLTLKENQSFAEQLDPSTQQWHKNNEISPLDWNNTIVTTSTSQIFVFPNGHTIPGSYSISIDGEPYTLNIK